MKTRDFLTKEEFERYTELGISDKAYEVLRNRYENKNLGKFTFSDECVSLHKNLVSVLGVSLSDYIDKNL